MYQSSLIEQIEEPATRTVRIAALLTTFNRKDKTLACLQSLSKQNLLSNTSITIHLTDDGSSDGTADAVKSYYPEAHIYHGNGSLFWAGGMRSSWSSALGKGYDYYLLLNDDTFLTETAVQTLLSHPRSSSSICVGTTADAEGKLTYGGRKIKNKVFVSDYRVYSENSFLDCDLGNANIMLVAAGIVQRIGILSQNFTHGIADYDYTLKARKAGFGVVVAPGILGMCVHDHGKNWKPSGTSLKERIAYLKSPKGLAYKEYLEYIKDHFPLYYPSAFTKLWVKTLFPSVWERLKK